MKFDKFVRNLLCKDSGFNVQENHYKYGFDFRILQVCMECF